MLTLTRGDHHRQEREHKGKVILGSIETLVRMEQGSRYSREGVAKEAHLPLDLNKEGTISQMGKALQEEGTTRQRLMKGLLRDVSFVQAMSMIAITAPG